MTIQEAKKGLLVVHRDSPIGETHEHFYSVSSVNNTIEKLVKEINKLKRVENLFFRLLETICEASDSVTKEDTDTSEVTMPNFRYEPTFEFYEDDIKLLKDLYLENEGIIDLSKLIE